MLSYGLIYNGVCISYNAEIWVPWKAITYKKQFIPTYFCLCFQIIRTLF